MSRHWQRRKLGKDQIGIRTAQTIVNYFNGEDVLPEQLIPTALYRKADALSDPELK